MKTTTRHRIAVAGAYLSRLTLGAMFVFSGFVKAVDPMGTVYKLEDYFAAFGMGAWFPRWEVMILALLLSTLEFCLGIGLLTGTRKTSSAILSLLFLGVMTPLTFYLYLTNPVSDCGCFGDAWLLTNGETFAKNLLMLAAAILLYVKHRDLASLVTPKTEWLCSLYSLLFILALSSYCLHSLPILDFRPYKIGVNIHEGMSIPEGKKPDQWESLFLMEKEGEQREFTLDNYPDSTWHYISTRSVLKEKGYTPPIHDFVLELMEDGTDLTDSLLTTPGYTFLLVAHRIEETDDSHIDLINEIYDYSVEHGYGFFALTSSPQEEVEIWSERTGGEYPFCIADDITLKTMIRSNPGLILLKGGTILQKWSHNDLPDEYVLTAPLEQLEIGQLRPTSLVRTLGYTIFWFIIPLLFIIAADTYWTQYQRRKSRMTKGKTAEKEEKESGNPKLPERGLKEEETEAKGEGKES